MEKIKCVCCGKDEVNSVIHVSFQCNACGVKFGNYGRDEKYFKNVEKIKQSNDKLFSLFYATIKIMDQMGIGLGKDLKKKVDSIKEELE